MNSLLTKQAILRSTVALLAATIQGADAFGQISVTWTGATGDWTSGANWTGNGGFPPEGGFGEQAVINNGGVAQLATTYLNDLGVLGGPGNLILGQEVGDSGTLEISAAGDLLLETGANVNRFVDVGAGEIGTGGVGTLSISDTGRFQANNVFSGGQAESLISVSGSGSLIAENDATLRATTRITGPDATFSVANNLVFGGAGTFNPVITGAAHSVIAAGGSATLNGSLSVDFSGFTPTAGDVWPLATATSFNGAFDDIVVDSGYTLGPGESLVTQTFDNGTDTTLQLALTQVLTVTVDRNTGAVAIDNPGANPVAFDAYRISANGSLNGSWQSLADQNLTGWDESPSSSASRLIELNPTDSLMLAGASSQSLGTPYQPDFGSIPFGESPEDGFAFVYTDPATGTQVDGEVVFTGSEVFNNLVLTIDPNTGSAVLRNDAPAFVADIDGYAITSATGALLAGNWDSLADQGVEGGTWDDSSSANGATLLTELNPTDSTAFGSGVSFNLGQIFDPGVGLTEADIALEFVLDGDTQARAGAVLFASLELTADYNADGVVDAADYTVWRDNEGTSNVLPNDPIGGVIGSGQYDQWAANYGAIAGAGASAVSAPEPGTLVCLLIAAASSMTRQRR